MSLSITKTIILPFLYGCKTKSLRPYFERNIKYKCLRIVLRDMSEPKKDEMSEKFRKLHNVELLGLYRVLSTVRTMKAGRL
jgi:hypothetical protein